MVSRATLLAARRSVAPLSPPDADGDVPGAGSPALVAPLRSLAAAYATHGGLATVVPSCLTLLPVPGEGVDPPAGRRGGGYGGGGGPPGVANRVGRLACLTVGGLAGPGLLLEAGAGVSHDMAKLGRLLDALGPLDASAVARCVGTFAMDADARSVDAPPPLPRLPLGEVLDAA